MTDLIHRITAWLWQPGVRTQARRGANTPTSSPRWIAPRMAAPALPTHRSPYGLDDADPLPGEATALVRPYLTADEQRRRRRELVLATLGIDAPGPYWIHGMEVA
ncbi:hypothetical protein [Streptomyces mesophilus]|uniref:hypothetical protein n=1 Tax=Streptomyces mesophilus TaxID=1775132 RepID=UPI00332B9F70